MHAPKELKTPDLIILPGTKSTISDLKWLRQCGLEAAVKRLVAQNTPVFGVCGGYQMLGERILDAEGVEGGGDIDGIGLLPVTTEFTGEKRRTRVTGKVLPSGGALASLSGAEVEGYEIHMGKTTLNENAEPLVLLENRQQDGCRQDSAYGTYLHGFFDTAPCRTALLTALCNKKGVSLETSAFDLKAYKESQYDLLASAMREHLDMKLIYRILEEGL